MRVRSGRMVLALIVGCWASALLFAAVLFPPYRAPDEGAHLDMVRAHVRAPRPFEEFRSLAERSVAPAALTGYGGVLEEVPPLPAGAAPDRWARPPFDRSAPDGPSEGRNQMTQHPQTYYLLNAFAQRALGRVVGTPWNAWPYDAQLLGMRAFSVALTASLPLLYFAAARRAGAAWPAGLAAAAVPLAVPRMLHIGAAVNSDNLLVPGMALLTAALAGVVSRRDGWADALLAGAAGAVALLAKGFGLVALPWIAVAYLLRVLPRDGRAAAAARGATALGLAGAGGGWYWARNLVVHGTVQPDHASYGLPPPAFRPDLDWWAGFAAQRLVGRFWIEPTIVQGLWRVEFLPTCAAAAWLLWSAIAAVRTGRGAVVPVLLFPFASSLAIMLYGAWGLYVRTAAPHGIDSRYLYPTVPALACLAALGADALPRPARRWCPAVMVLTAAALQAWALDAALGFYWGDQRGGPLLASLRAVLAWSPAPPLWPVLTGSAAAALLAAAAAFAIRDARQRGERLPPGPSTGPAVPRT